MNTTVRYLAVLALSVASATACAEYDGYRDWRLVQEFVACTNADEAVRPHWDFTNPMHGPWLTNPSSGSMTVTYISRTSCAAGIEYRAHGEEAWTRRWNTLYGLLNYSSDIHVFHLAGLRPGTDYECRFVTACSQYNTAYVGTCVGRETYTFRTLDPAKKSYKVFVTTDVHGSLRLTADAMYGRSDAAEADFYLFLGDNVNDNMNEPRFYITNGFIDDVTRLWGTAKPTVFVRGNHDCWGRHAADGWRDYYGRPDGKGYFMVAQGPALFIVLDCAEEYFKKQAVAAQEVAAQYRAEQLVWLEDLKRTETWRKATFRIVLSHYGTRIGGERDKSFTGFATAFRSSLDEADPARRIHLLLCGHEHFYARCLPRTKGFYHNPRNDRPNVRPRQFPRTEDETFNFTEICGNMNESMTVEVSLEKLVVRSHDVTRKGAPDLDVVEIRPDGTACAQE